RPADADVSVQRGRTVLGQDPDVEDAGVHTVGEREVDDAVLARERHRRLGAALGQQAQPRAETAGQDEGIALRAQGRTSSSRRSGTRTPGSMRRSRKSCAPAPTPSTAPRPTSAPSGTRAYLPSKVNGSWAPAAPSPTRAPSPIQECLSRMAR